MKNIILLFLIPFASFSQNEELCDSINIDFIGYNVENNHFEIDVSTEYTTTYWFGYCGFIITTNEGDTIAAENINSAGNVYGLGNNMIETRYLEILEENFNFSINGEIHLVEGFFAGNGTIACSYPFIFNCNDIDNNGFCDEEDIPNLTYIPDDNFEQALIDLGVDDVLDDYVLTDIVSTLSYIDLSMKEIDNLTGIEDFTSLVYLECSENNLSELDISNNTLLTNFGCNNNNLSELDVSNNTLLTTLHCGQNNLAALNVSNNNLLTDIWCHNNWVLEELDISNNTLLTGLQCQANNLSELDVSNNPDLGILICNTNNLTELNLTNNAQTLVLDCSNNELVELDISNNTLLTGLQCQQNALLNCIQVWDVEYVQSNSNFYKDEDAIWSLDCEYGMGIEQNSKNKILLKSTDMLGRLSTKGGCILKIYDDGSVEKKYSIK